jgi:hypothetical protein
MARGSSQSDLRSKAKKSPILPVEKRIAILDAASERLKKTKDLDTKARVRAFAEAVFDYTSHTHKEYEGHKERKQAIIDAYKDLPKFVRDAISHPSEPMSKLYRGGTHPSNPGPDGKVHASFTADEEVADGFATTTAGRIFTGKDIASHGPIINIKAFGYLRDEFGGYVAADGDDFDPASTTSQMFGRFNYTALIAEEDEHIITNIKWKPTASDMPAGKVRGYLRTGPWDGDKP